MRPFKRRLARCAPGLALLAGLLAAGPAVALDYLNVTVQPDRAVPAACLSFTTELPRGKAQGLEPYVAVEPKIDHSLEVRGKDLCIGGFKHGQHYSVRIKAGLPGADGTALSKDVPVDIQIPDREAQLFFDQGKTLLPFTKGVGLPVKSVNVAKAHITLYRFTDRAPSSTRSSTIGSASRDQRLQPRYDRRPQRPSCSMGRWRSPRRANKSGRRRRSRSIN